MSLLQFSASGIPATISIIIGFIKENPILCGVMFTSYTLYYLYSFIHNKTVDSDVYEIDLISSAVSTVMVVLLLIGLDESSKGFSITNLDINTPTTKIVIFLSIFAFILLFFAFTKILPKFLVVLLGNSELDLFINFGAVLMTDPEIALTGTVLAALGVPLIGLFIIQRLRRLMR